jgi:hypothetical protein
MDKQQRRQIAAEYKKRKQMGGVYSIRCTQNGKQLLLSTMDMAGSENRFRFAQGMGGCVHPKLRQDWDLYGGKAFSFDIIETLEQKDMQADDEFQRDVVTLLDMLMSKDEPEALY